MIEKEVLRATVESGLYWKQRAEEAERHLQYKTVEWSTAIEIGRKLQLENERLRSIEAAARALIKEAYDDGFGRMSSKVMDELLICGVHEALDDLRAALEGKL